VGEKNLLILLSLLK